MKKNLTGERFTTSQHNFTAFLWHAAFLAFAQNFMDIDTVIPAMLIEAGGNSVHVGIMSAILLGGSSFTQIIFAPYLSNQSQKKKFLLLGINSRILSLLGLGLILYFWQAGSGFPILWMIFLFITLFALGGAFANISYTDILGKSIEPVARKSFFSSKQIINGTIVLLSVVAARQVLVSRPYPVNYAFMFFIGFAALFIASLGFWSIRETVPSQTRISGVRQFIDVMKQELKTNPRLKYFLGFINTQGIAIGFLPFVILYAKDIYGTESSDTAFFLISKVLGSVAVSMLVFAFRKHVRYRYLLYSNVILALVMPLLIMLPGGRPSFFPVFIIGGVVYAMYSIAMNGVLLEVSGNDNRALYAGFAGAGNIIPALFPIVGGWLISQFGFTIFFSLFMAIVLFSLFFVYKINCQK